MEDNNRNTEEELDQETEEGESAEKRVQYTKQQSFLYTVISVALFFLIYFAVKGITSAVNMPYRMLAYGEDLSQERSAEAFSISGILPEGECLFDSARLEKGSDGYVFTALFIVNERADDDEFEDIAEKIIDFEYGDPDEEIRTGFYPYHENPYYSENAYGEKFVDIESPYREVILFNWNGSVYAQYRQYGTDIPSEIRALFSETEKVY